MIKIKELLITPNGKCLVIDAMVTDHEDYINVFLNSIIIDTQDTFVVGGPSKEPIYKNIIGNKKDEWKTSISIKEYESGVKEGKRIKKVKNIRLVLDASDLGVDLNTNMFFVYIIAEGYPAPNVQCGRDNRVTLATVLNLYELHRKGLCYLKELGDRCCIPKGLMQFVLKLKALEMCVSTGQYLEAIKYWKYLNKDAKPVAIINKCYG